MKSCLSFILLFCFSYLLSQQETEKQIDGIVIKKVQKKYKNKKDNPAYAIMKEVWSRKKNNALEKFDTYSLQEYEKIQYDVANIDSAFINSKIFQGLDFIFKYTDSATHGKPSLPVYLNESIYNHFVQNSPTKRKKKLMIAQKSSGFEENELVRRAGQNLYREINLYDNVINYFDIGFQSPVGENAFATYHFAITDTIHYRSQKAFVIQFEPRIKEALAFTGSLYISTDEYSVLRAILRSPAKMGVNFVNGVFTVIEYDNPDKNTFLPQKLSTSIELSPFSKNKKIIVRVSSLPAPFLTINISLTFPSLRTSLPKKKKNNTRIFILRVMISGSKIGMIHSLCRKKVSTKCWINFKRRPSLRRL